MTILRRIARHVREQNWTAIGIEFLIVVVGVFLGLQAQDWASARAQAEQHHRYYDRLHADFVSIRDRIDSHLATFEQVIAGAEYILELVRLPDAAFRETGIDRARFEDALSLLTEQRIPPGRSATYVEMLSAGQLSSLRDATLRDRLAEYDRTSEIHLEVFRATQMNNSSQTPVVYRHFKVVTVSDPDMMSGIRNRVHSHDLEGMRSDPEFETAVMILHQNTLNNLGVRRRESQLAAEILQRLEGEEAR